MSLVAISILCSFLLLIFFLFPHKKLGGAALLKAPTYKLVEENSKFTNSFSYSLDQLNRKSLFYPMCSLGNLGDSDQPFYGNIGKSSWMFEFQILVLTSPAMNNFNIISIYHFYYHIKMNIRMHLLKIHQYVFPIITFTSELAIQSDWLQGIILQTLYQNYLT